MKISNPDKFLRVILLIIIAIVAFRLLSLGFDVLTDPTEARYAEIGRRMAESGNFVTPYISDNFPFWAKPPLSFWATAGSIKLFGLNEFAVKFPHFLFLVGASVIAYFFARKYTGRVTAAVSSAVLAVTPLFMYWAGGVMTDPALVFCVTLCMTSFYDAIYQNKKIFGYLFFVGLGLGLLAKGPLIFVLVGLSTGLFIAIKNKWREMFRAMPWVGGTFVMLAIAVPWYILAERATPGFLHYFIIGEHWQRYLQPHWTGDLYGGGRGGWVGKIWLYWFIVLMPWTIYIMVKSFSKKFRETVAQSKFFQDEFLFYLICFAFAPLLFFSLSKNIIITYAIISIIPSSILIAKIVPMDSLKFKWFGGIVISAMCIIISIDVIAPAKILVAKPTEKFTVLAAGNSNLYYYKMNVPYSASFYSDGAARRIDNLSVTKPGDFIVLHNENIRDFSGKFEIIPDINKRMLVKIK